MDNNGGRIETVQSGTFLQKFLGQLNDNDLCKYNYNCDINGWSYLNNLIYQQLFPLALNRFELDTEDDNFKFAWLIAESWLFFIPNVAITKDESDDYVVVSYNQAEYANNGQPVSAKGTYLLTSMFGFNGSLSSMKKISVEFNLTSENAIFLRNNIWNFPTLFYAKPYLEYLCQVWTNISKDLTSCTRYLFLKGRAVGQDLYEKELLTPLQLGNNQPKWAYIFNSLSAFDGSVTIEPSSAIETIIGYKNMLLNELKLQLALRTNSLEKQQRNSAQEGVFVEAEWNQFENYYYNVRELVLKQAKEVFGVKATLLKQSDLIDTGDLNPQASNNTSSNDNLKDVN